MFTRSQEGRNPGRAPGFQTVSKVSRKTRSRGLSQKGDRQRTRRCLLLNSSSSASWLWALQHLAGLGLGFLTRKMGAMIIRPQLVIESPKERACAQLLPAVSPAQHPAWLLTGSQYAVLVIVAGATIPGRRLAHDHHDPMARTLCQFEELCQLVEASRALYQVGAIVSIPS